MLVVFTFSRVNTSHGTCLSFKDRLIRFECTVDCAEREKRKFITNKLHVLTLGKGDLVRLQPPTSYEAGSDQGLVYMPVTAMPRRKRQSPTDEEDMDFWSRQSHKKARPSTNSRKRVDGESSFSSKRCIAWFVEYTETDSPDVLGPEGMEKFCEDIAVEPENIVMLCLAYKLGAKQMGFFTKAEWLKGMTELQCDGTNKVQQKLDYLKSLLDDPPTFKAIYRYAFDFAREKEQRGMDMDTAKAMLALLLGKHWSLFPHFHNFLEHSKYKVLNKDQWSNVLEFSRLILPDLSNYDEDGAWPVILDEFVEWHREQYPDLHKRSSTSASSADTSSMQTQTYC